jgi:hypothetical protein
VKIVRIAVFTIATLAVLAIAAAPAGAEPVAADARYKWYYWIGPLLVIGAILLLLALGLGYYIRVLRPKYRGKPVNK